MTWFPYKNRSAFLFGGQYDDVTHICTAAISVSGPASRRFPYALRPLSPIVFRSQTDRFPYCSRCSFDFRGHSKSATQVVCAPPHSSPGANPEPFPTVVPPPESKFCGHTTCATQRLIAAHSPSAKLLMSPMLTTPPSTSRRPYAQCFPVLDRRRGHTTPVSHGFCAPFDSPPPTDFPASIELATPSRTSPPGSFFRQPTKQRSPWLMCCRIPFSGHCTSDPHSSAAAVPVHRAIHLSKPTD